MDVISPKVEATEIGEEEVRDSFSELIGTKHRELSDFFGENNDVLLVLNDANRPTPTAFLLETIDDYLKTIDKDKSLLALDPDVVIATGSHSSPSERELKKILGKFYSELREDTVIHRAKENSHFRLGKTSRGTPISVDEAILGYDCVLNINSVEPHYFAGYTGGRKSLVPGVCGWETIEENHEFALKENSCALSLDCNPVHLDMVEAAEKIMNYLDASFCSINVVCDSSGLYDVCCGNFFSSFDSLVNKAKEVFSREVSHKYDVVVARVSEPLNKSLYQSLKGFENAKLVTEEGGVLVLVTECKEGVGPSEFYEALNKRDDPDKIIEDIKRNYSLGEHKASNLLRFLDNHDLYIVSDLSDELVENCFCKPFSDLETALEAAEQRFGEDASILKLKKAGNVVPRVP